MVFLNEPGLDAITTENVVPLFQQQSGGLNWWRLLVACCIGLLTSLLLATFIVFLVLFIALMNYILKVMLYRHLLFQAHSFI